MAYEGTIECIPGAVAGADLSSSQFLCVVMDANAEWITAAATSGWILQNAPADGAAAEIAYSGLVKAIAGDTVTAGMFLMSDAAGKVVEATTKNLTCGLCVTGATVNKYASVLLFAAWKP